MCTVGFVKDSSGKVILFSTSDNPFTTRTRLLVKETAKADKFISTQITCEGVDVPWNGMYSRGLNSHGFAFTWAAAIDTASLPAEGKCYIEAGEFFLEECKEVAQVYEWLDSGPRLFAGNFIFADANNNVVYIEIGYSSYAVLDLNERNNFVITNHRILPEMQRFAGAEPHGSIVRRASAVDCLKNCNSVDRVQALLKHVDLDYVEKSICAGIKENATIVSVSAEILIPDTRAMYYCYGWPSTLNMECADKKGLQSKSWGEFQRFSLNELEAGELVSSQGELKCTVG